MAIAVGICGRWDVRTPDEAGCEHLAAGNLAFARLPRCRVQVILKLNFKYV